MRRALMTFERGDGSVQAEILTAASEFAELVNLESGEVLHRDPFVLNGAEWIVHAVSLSEGLVKITCVPAGSLNGSPEAAAAWRAGAHAPSTP